MRAVVSSGWAVDFGTQWQGKVVDARFPLDQYLGGSDRAAIYLTRIEGAKAAIKLVRASACDPEAQLAAWNRASKLSHPHLIRLFAGGRCWLAGNDLLFVVTELAEENLSQVLPHRALSAAEAEIVLRGVTSALVYLHGQDLVHGHIRPANVMAIDEQIKLSSDGIQAPGASVQVLEESAYHAPELASRRLSAAADMWSLGVTVAEVLTQSAPLKAAGLNLPQPFADVVRHTLVREPASRWKAADVLERLQPAAGQSKSSVGASTPVGSAKSRALIWAAIALVVLAVVALAVFMRRGPQATQPTQTASAPVAVAATSSSTSSQTAVQDSSGSVLGRVMPSPSRSALDTITGHVKVRLRVDVNSAGKVTNASFVSEGPSHYFARLAMEAAQQWKFTAEIRNGQAVPSEWNLLFEYTRGGVEASAQPARSR